jgi:hypothetical protein
VPVRALGEHAISGSCFVLRGHPNWLTGVHNQCTVLGEWAGAARDG